MYTFEETLVSQSLRPLGRLGRAAVVLMCVVLAGAQACDKNQPTPDPIDAKKKDMSAPTARVDAGADAHADAEVKKIEVKDIGPPAPGLFIVGGLKGYTEPCGCTLDIKAGGIDRIAGVIAKARSFHAGQLTLDVGNIWFETAKIGENQIEQEELTARMLAKAYAHLGVAASVPGPTDFARGVELYKELMATAKIEAIAANMSVGGEALDAFVVRDVEGMKVGVVGGVDPALYEGIEGIAASELEPKIGAALKEVKAAGADVTVMIYHGPPEKGRALVKAHPEIDFIVLAEKARETDQVDEIGRSRTLEVMDQGRYVGWLKLYNPEGVADDAAYENSRVGSKSELEAIERQIKYVNESINKLPPAAPGEESPILAKLRERLAGLEEREEGIKNSAVKVPEGKRAFIWRSLRLDEGYPSDPEIRASVDALKLEIDELNRGQTFEVVPVKEGEPFYVGSVKCQACHAEAFAFWKKTNHGTALDTLIEQKKDFNQDCVGCHVVGFEEPGGSVLGKLEYTVKFSEAGLDLKKDLRHVGCENCHGPGSRHVEAAMFGKLGDPKQHINNKIDETTCTQSCHVTEHSPRFNWDTYIEQITGEGHARGGS